MDPITLILTALTAGATDSIKDATSEAVKDGYNGLKALIQRKFSDNADATTVLEKYEKKPEIWKAPLADELAQSRADQDQEIITKAQRLMAIIQPEQAAIGKFNIRFSNSRGVVIGENNQVTNNFGDELKEN